MKKNFTFILLSLLLFVVGGAKSQTALPIKGGHQWVAYEEQYEKDPSWNQDTSDDHYSGVVKIKGNTAKWGRLGGKGWAGSYTGAKHTFTFVLRNDVKNRWNQDITTSTYSQFVLVAIKGGTYKSSGDTNDLDDSNNNWDGSNQIKNGNGSNETKIVATTGTLTPTFVDNEATITLEVNASYDAVYFYTPQGSGGNGCIKIKSITRTEGAGKATAPTITPASTDYSGSIEVTITKGSGNTAVAYTVTGADGGDISTTFTAAELSAGSKVLNLTGSGDITVTATGSEDGKDDSNTASCTYTYVIEAPTITPGTSNYDGELTVTITPGSNNHHAKYTVSGSNENKTDVVITSATTLNLTGSGTITITATGYNSAESESSSNTEYTYTYVAPSSGIISVWTGSTTFADGNAGWGTNVELNKSNFSTLEVGDYIYLKVSTPHGEVPNIGFRNNWDDSCQSYTDTSGGNVAYGNMESDEPYWWLKVTDATLLSLFKDGQPRIQGQSFTLTGVEIHKAKTISETEDNTILKCSDYIINLDRSFVANTWNTVCLPFVPTADQAEELFGEGYTIAEFTGVTGTTLEFTTFAIKDFEAGQPYLVKPTASLSTPVVLFDVDITAKNGATVTHDGYSFTGTFTTKSFAEGDWATTRFVATGNKLNTPNSTNAMKALRCYFTVPAESSARGYAIDGFMDDDVPTDISATLNDNVQTTKVIYNLAGQRVANPTKGLYIVNGQKVVVK